MSLPESSSDPADQPRGVLVRRPKTSIYTVLLLITLVAIILSCVIMALELSVYDFQFKPPANYRSDASVVPAAFNVV